MADLMAVATDTLGKTLLTTGQNIQAAGAGNFSPLMGQMLPTQVNGLLGQVQDFNKPAPEAQPDQNGVVAPPPNKYAGLLESMSMTPEQRRIADEMAKKTLAQSAYGKYY